MSVPGLFYIPNFISEEQEVWLVKNIDANEWDTSIQRRTQHYGYRYDYRSKSADDNYIGPLPEWLCNVINWAEKREPLFPLAEQVIVNEYQRGQGINMHTDRRDQFGPVIASISLLSDVVMDFEAGPSVHEEQLLARRSLLILTGLARTRWAHGFKGSAIKSRRISLTFRTMLEG